MTGAGSGIGKSIADALAKAGAAVCINYYGAYEEAAREHAKSLPRAIAVSADISSPDAAAALVATTVEELGGLDILVNNAGIERSTPLLDLTIAEWDAAIAVNLRGAFCCLQAAAVARVMRDAGQGGSIINISSIHEDVAFPGYASYCASKGGLRMLMRNAAVELAAYKIRVNNIAPGAIATPINLGDVERSREGADPPAGSSRSGRMWPAGPRLRNTGGLPGVRPQLLHHGLHLLRRRWHGPLRRAALEAERQRTAQLGRNGRTEDCTRVEWALRASPAQRKIGLGGLLGEVTLRDFEQGSLVASSAALALGSLAPDRARLRGIRFSFVAVSPLGAPQVQRASQPGGHVFGFWCERHLHPHDLAGYICGQRLGAILGAGLVRLAWGGHAATVHYGVTAPGHGLDALERRRRRGAR